MLAISPMVFGQQKMIVFLAQKTPEKNPVQQISPRAELRRAQRQVVTDNRDLALNPEYLDQLREHARVLNTSRWLNAVSLETALSPEELQSVCPFIQRIQVIAQAPPRDLQKEGFSQKSLDYGEGIAQVYQLNLQCLHEYGFTGQGMYVGIIDAGFILMDSIAYFDSVYLENRVLDLHNFVDGTNLVYQASSHGTAVASCIVGEKADPNKFAGTAVDVDLALYLAEDVNSETEIEEFNVVAALERCDSVGVDAVNISLGYFDFDDSLTNHVYADLDGNTTIAAMGVNVAASKGIAVVVAAGNSGPSNISTPCDADSGLCVGAVDVFGSYALFSSVGPNADGQVKPDVMARGQDAWVVVPPGDLVTGNGTSFATPIMCGATTCLMQAHPNKTVAEIFEALRMSASLYTTPDPYMGYGIPDLCVADGLLTGVGLAENKMESLFVYPNPGNGIFNLSGTIQPAGLQFVLVNAVGQIVMKGATDVNGRIDAHHLESGVYILQISAEDGVFYRQTVQVTHF